MFGNHLKSIYLYPVCSNHNMPRVHNIDIKNKNGFFSKIRESIKPIKQLPIIPSDPHRIIGSGRGVIMPEDWNNKTQGLDKSIKVTHDDTKSTDVYPNSSKNVYEESDVDGYFKN